MNLSIDIGNTNTKFGLFNDRELKEVFTGREEIEGILQRYKIKRAIISRTGSDEVIEYRLKEKKVKTIFLNPDLLLPVKILYKTPHTLGADRLAGSVAAQGQFPGQNILKLDFGTCITYDVVNAQGEYLGGAIAPGMLMRFKALHNYTAKLPLVDPMQFKEFELTGTDTPTSILSGVINGIKYEVEGIINEYRLRLGSLKVVATGGDAGLFAALIKSEIFARPYLVLEGLNEILNYNP